MQGAVLRFKKQGRRRNRIVAALMLPALAFIWLVGWSLCWIGGQRDARSEGQPRQRGAGVALIPASALDEQPLEVAE